MPRRSAKSQPQALRLIALIGHQVYKLPQRPPVTLLLIAGASAVSKPCFLGNTRN